MFLRSFDLTCKLTWDFNYNSSFYNAYPPDTGAAVIKISCQFTPYHIEAETKWSPFRRRHFQAHFLERKFQIAIKISLKFVPKSPIDNIPALFQIMGWRRPGAKLLSEAMMVSLLTHICVARPQWVKVKQCRYIEWWHKHKIEAKYSISNWKCSTAHKYPLNQSKWTFST